MQFVFSAIHATGNAPVVPHQRKGDKSRSNLGFLHQREGCVKFAPNKNVEEKVVDSLISTAVKMI